MKKLKEEESLPFSPSCAADFLQQWYLLLHPPWQKGNSQIADKVTPVTTQNLGHAELW